MKSQIELKLKEPEHETVTILNTSEFMKYIATEVYERFVRDTKMPIIEAPITFAENLAENWNKYAPHGKDGYDIEVLSLTENRKKRINNLNSDRLTIASYALHNYDNPKTTLESISAKLYEYKGVFNDRMMYLTTDESIQEAKQYIKNFNTAIIKSETKEQSIILNNSSSRGR